ncbi:Asp-tRNA(Asn)/Glu-tRNA(Gln) amidotransferase subunit GatC [Ornithinibacillus sp. 4-3]|uniref:Aspartyl/glutamyl-tRNA(Asn/Gln) amidotransferase subunit C n=1 Tax=Ornithinibacillus sp. 4-3 TaxID=3231488 RepID=A0AB39HQX8_9BACI
MDKVSKEQVIKIADLVRLALSEEEVDKYTEKINASLEYAQFLNEVNTDDVEPTTHGIVLQNVMRDDTPEYTISQEEALQNAPEQQDGHFKVPSIMD